MAAEFDQRVAVAHGFHAFGDDVVIERMRHAYDPVDDAAVLRILEHVAHEAVVDFHRFHQQAAKIGERRRAGAEPCWVNVLLDLNYALSIFDNTQYMLT